MTDPSDDTPPPGLPGSPQAPEPGGDASLVVHHVSQRKKRRRDDKPIGLQLTSMIDVIFQLLIYFVITANFMIDEGTVKATMPGQSAPVTEIVVPDPPVYIDLHSSDDGMTYRIVVDGMPLGNQPGGGGGAGGSGGASALYDYLIVQLQDRNGVLDPDSDIRIRPQGKVRWQHVVNVFNACTRAELANVGFTVPN